MPIFHDLCKMRSLGIIMLHLKRKNVLFVFMAVYIILVTIQPVSAAAWNITGSTFTHDPSVIREGSTWWQFYTADGIGVKYSSNGTAWNQGTPIFKSNLSWWNTYVPDKTDRNIWAPDIFYYSGRYWLYYSVSTFGANTSCIGLTSCTSIAKGDWRDDGLVLRSTTSNNYNCIDPGIIEDTTGNIWMSFGSFWSGIKIVQLDKSTMKPISGAAIRSVASRPDVSGNPVEAAYIVYANGYYYLFVSWDSCCNGVNSTYKIAYGRSTSVTGPYLDQSGKDMLQGGGTLLEQSETRWKGPGGQSVAQNGSGWIMVRHAYDANNNGTATLRISDLYFTNGWPSYTPPANVPGGSLYQAEDAVRGGNLVTENTNAGYFGTGYVNFPASDGYLEFKNIDGGSGGKATLLIRYSLGSDTSRTGRLQINGGDWQNISFDPSGAWTNWSVKELEATLHSGSGNTIRLESIGQDLANIDQLDVTIVSVKKGDVNEDGNVDALDFGLVKKHILETGLLSGNGLKAADVDGSGTVDALDYSKIKMYLLGLISEL